MRTPMYLPRLLSFTTSPPPVHCINSFVFAPSFSLSFSVSHLSFLSLFHSVALSPFRSLIIYSSAGVFMSSVHRFLFVLPIPTLLVSPLFPPFLSRLSLSLRMPRSVVSPFLSLSFAPTPSRPLLSSTDCLSSSLPFVVFHSLFAFARSFFLLFVRLFLSLNHCRFSLLLSLSLFLFPLAL